MRTKIGSASAFLAILWVAVPAVGQGLTLEPLGVYPPAPDPAALDKAAAEIVAHDFLTQRLFIVNVFMNRIDIVDITDPDLPSSLGAIDIAPFHGHPTHVAVRKGHPEIAVAVPSDVATDPGKVVFFDTDGVFLASVVVGVLPDMLLYTEDGKKVLVANEGQPNDAYTIDPEGSVSIIDVERGARRVKQKDVCTADFRVFNGKEGLLRAKGIRIFGPGAFASEDFEPEYVTVSDDSKTAWVVLQENNAIAEIDVKHCRVTNLFPLGYKNHSLARNKLDASDKDSLIRIKSWPVKGMYQPDAIHWFKGFLFGANEGDSRAYPGFSEEKRVGDADVILDPVAFPNAADLKLAANLGRLRITNSPPSGKSPAGVYSELHAFGARSFSAWSQKGKLVFDSGDDFEQIIAAAFPDNFNANHAANDFDTRSDDKGPEPEGLTLGTIRGCTYAFVTLERIGGVMVYNITNPVHPEFVQYVNTRDFSGNPAAGTAGDLGPEGVIFISRRESPIRAPLLVVANEVSGTTRIFKIVATGRCQDDEDADD